MVSAKAPLVHVMGVEGVIPEVLPHLLVVATGVHEKHSARGLDWFRAILRQARIREETILERLRFARRDEARRLRGEPVLSSTSARARTPGRKTQVIAF